MSANLDDAVIADPGVGGRTAEMAFQGPDTDVTVGLSPNPRRIEFTGTPPPVQPDKPLFPPSLLGRQLEWSSKNGLEKDAEEYGLFWVRITQTHSDGTPGGVTGRHGVLLNFGDEVQLPGNDAALLVGQGSAVFLFEGSTRDDVEFVKKAEKLGYKVEPPRLKRIDRPEYSHLKKGKSWMAKLSEP